MKGYGRTAASGELRGDACGSPRRRPRAAAYPVPELPLDGRPDLPLQPGPALVPVAPRCDAGPGEALDFGEDRVHALVLEGRGVEHGGRGPVLPHGADVQEEAEGVEQGLRALEVRLVDEEHVGGLDDPGLEGLDDVSGRGLEDEDDEVGAVEDVELGLADADGLDEDPVHAEGVEDVGGVGRRRREPAVAVPGGHRADEDAVARLEVLHADPVAQEGAA